jgi:hypothetical protein
MPGGPDDAAGTPIGTIARVSPVMRSRLARGDPATGGQRAMKAIVSHLPELTEEQQIELGREWLIAVHRMNILSVDIEFRKPREI